MQLVNKLFENLRFLILLTATIVGISTLLYDILPEDCYELMVLLEPATVPINMWFFFIGVVLLLVLNYELRNVLFENLSNAEQISRRDNNFFLELFAEGCYVLGFIICTYGGIAHWVWYLVGGVTVLLCFLLRSWIQPEKTTFGDLVRRDGG